MLVEVLPLEHLIQSTELLGLDHLVLMNHFIRSCSRFQGKAGGTSLDGPEHGIIKGTNPFLYNSGDPVVTACVETAREKFLLRLTITRLVRLCAL
jgi:hypothetical protein